MSTRPISPFTLIAICCAGMLALFIGGIVAGFMAGMNEAPKPTIIRMKIVEKPKSSP